MPDWSVDVEEDLSVLLRRLQASARNPKPLMHSGGSVLQRRIRSTFRTKQDPYGRAWPPKVGGGDLMRDTGRLARSWTLNVGNRDASVGTNVCYAPVHQRGATVKATGLAGAGRVSLCGYVTTGADYLAFKIGNRWVRTKSVKIPARPMAPVLEKGFPAKWQQAIERAMIKRWKKEITK